MTERISTAHALSVPFDVTWFIDDPRDDIHCFVAFFFYCCIQRKVLEFVLFIDDFLSAIRSP